MSEFMIGQEVKLFDGKYIITDVFNDHGETCYILNDDMLVYEWELMNSGSKHKRRNSARDRESKQ